MMKKTKWLALLLAGVMLLGTLSGCGIIRSILGGDEGGDENGENDDFSDYEDLSPEEAYDALLDAKQVALTRTLDGDSGRTIHQLYRDGNIVMYGNGSETVYYDLKEDRRYWLDIDTWKNEEDDSSWKDLVTAFIETDEFFALFDDDNMEEDGDEYTLSDDAIDALKDDSGWDGKIRGSMEREGTTYTYVLAMTDSDKEPDGELTLQVSFSGQDVSLPGEEKDEGAFDESEYRNLSPSDLRKKLDDALDLKMTISVNGAEDSSYIKDGSKVYAKDGDWEAWYDLSARLIYTEKSSGMTVEASDVEWDALMLRDMDSSYAWFMFDGHADYVKEDDTYTLSDDAIAKMTSTYNLSVKLSGEIIVDRATYTITARQMEDPTNGDTVCTIVITFADQSVTFPAVNSGAETGKPQTPETGKPADTSASETQAPETQAPETQAPETTPPVIEPPKPAQPTFRSPEEILRQVRQAASCSIRVETGTDAVYSLHFIKDGVKLQLDRQNGAVSETAYLHFLDQVTVYMQDGVWLKQKETEEISWEDILGQVNTAVAGVFYSEDSAYTFDGDSDRFVMTDAALAAKGLAVVTVSGSDDTGIYVYTVTDADSGVTATLTVELNSTRTVTIPEASDPNQPIAPPALKNELLNAKDVIVTLIRKQGSDKQSVIYSKDGDLLRADQIYNGNTVTQYFDMNRARQYFMEDGVWYYQNADYELLWEDALDQISDMIGGLLFLGDDAWNYYGDGTYRLDDDVAGEHDATNGVYRYDAATGESVYTVKAIDRSAEFEVRISYGSSLHTLSLPQAQEYREEVTPPESSDDPVAPDPTQTYMSPTEMVNALPSVENVTIYAEASGSYSRFVKYGDWVMMHTGAVGVESDPYYIDLNTGIAYGLLNGTWTADTSVLFTWDTLLNMMNLNTGSAMFNDSIYSSFTPTDPQLVYSGVNESCTVNRSGTVYEFVAESGNATSMLRFDFAVSAFEVPFTV